MSPNSAVTDQHRFDLDEDGSGAPLRRLYREYGRRHRRVLMVGVCASLCYPLLAVLPPYFLQIAIDDILLQSREMSLPGVPGAWIPAERFYQLGVIAAVLVCAAMAAATLSAVSTLAWGRGAQAIQHDLRIDAYAWIQERPLDFVQSQQTGQLLSILGNDIDELDQLLQQGGKETIELVARFCGVVGILVWLHWELALLALSVLPAIGILSRWFFATIGPVYRATRQRIGILNARIENNLSGMRTIKAYARETEEVQRITDASESVYRTKWHATVLQATFFPGVGLVNAVGFGLLVLVGGYWITVGPPLMFSQELTVGTLVAFLLYNQHVREPLIDAGGVMNAYLELRASLVRIFCLAPTESNVRSVESVAVPDELSGRINVDDVTFGYTDGKPVLSGISLTIGPEEFIGIVGPTGSGKTSLASLLMGFYRSQAGEIRIDGTPIAARSKSTIRNSLALVSQDPHILSASIRDNVAYGDTTASTGEIESALAAADALAFVRELPDGIDTTVGQGGQPLSGGQRQRIAIARAIVREPAIMILDEATSDVDAQTEAALRETFQQLSGQCTVIVISHRLSTVRTADCIYLLEDGHIRECGTHTALLETGGRYREFWAEQTGTRPPHVPNKKVTPDQRGPPG